jgi:hypothetical protein
MPLATVSRSFASNSETMRVRVGMGRDDDVLHETRLRCGGVVSQRAIEGRAGG